MMKRCPNCMIQFEGKKTFCRDLCQETASIVRTYRTFLRDPVKQLDREWFVALYMRGLFINTAVTTGSGLYPRQERYLSPAMKAAIKERDNYKCVKCGTEGTEVDHIDGSSNDPNNLQTLCLKCHNEKTIMGVTSIDEMYHEILRAYWMQIAERVTVDTPIKLCDNEYQWSKVWRKWEDAKEEPYEIRPMTITFDYAYHLVNRAGEVYR